MTFVLITAILMTTTPTTLLQQITIAMDNNNTIRTTMTTPTTSFKHETQTKELHTVTIIVVIVSLHLTNAIGHPNVTRAVIKIPSVCTKCLRCCHATWTTTT